MSGTTTSSYFEQSDIISLANAALTSVQTAEAATTSAATAAAASASAAAASATAAAASAGSNNTSLTISAGTGVSVTGSSTSKTIALASSGITAGTYSNIVVDATGRLTSARALNSSDISTALGFTPSNGGGGGSGSVTSVGASGGAGINVTGSPITSSGTLAISLAPTGVTPGTYTYASITVDASGRIVTATSNAGGGGGGSSALGTAQVITASGTQAIDTTKALVIFSSPGSAINATLGSGSVDGQQIEVVVLPGATVGHSITGTFYEASTVFGGLSTPEGGISMCFVWSGTRNSWYPRSFDSGLKVGDLPTASGITANDQFDITQAGVDKVANVSTLQNYFKSFGTPQVITASGTTAIDTSKSLVVLSNTGSAINATLANGTVDGQEFQLVVLPTPVAVQHTIAGTIFEASNTLAVGSPNVGVSITMKYSVSRTSWYPRSYDGGYRLIDLGASSAVAGTDVLVIDQSGTDKTATVTQLATYSALNLPTWTTGGRPTLGSTQYGEGYNTSLGRFECWNGTAWYQKARLTGDTFTGATGVAPFALTDGATINTDASKANLFTVTLAGNRTLANPTNLVAGYYYAWEVTQDGSGSRTLSYGNLFTWKGGAAPTLSTAAGAVDVISGFYDGTKLRCAAALAFA